LPLLNLCGGLIIGLPDSTVVTGTLKSIEQHNLRHQVLSPTQVLARYPMFHLADDEIGQLFTCHPNNSMLS
jgi:sarcosine oxidase